MAPQPAYRLALAIHDHLLQQRSNIRTIELPDAAWQKCQLMQRQVRCALGRDWQLAARRLTRDFGLQLRVLSEHVRRALDESSAAAPKDALTAHDIYEEISSLQSEFDDVAWCIRESTLSVTTSEIVLQNIDLGRFQIELDWRKLPDSLHFRVIALIPTRPRATRTLRIHTWSTNHSV